MDKFMDIVVSDPQQRELAEEVEQRKKFLKKNGHVNKRIVTGWDCYSYYMLMYSNIQRFFLETILLL